MYIFNTIQEIQDYISSARAAGRKIGFVPTMGYLHEGHLELMRWAKQHCGTVVISIFVNPTQFGPKEDLAQYPKDLDRDVQMAESVGVDAIFHPSVAEMYPSGYCTYVDVERITERLCGLSRPGHFRGVATVVTKLFNIVKPDQAFFGQKDAQQVLVIKRMVADLNMGLEVVMVPTVREADGLAMSSRNIYLNREQRQAALVLNKSLKKAKEAVEAGQMDISIIHQLVVATIAAEPLAEIDYVEIYSYPELEPVIKMGGPVLVALAVIIGQTRLIDNMILGVEDQCS